MRSSWGCVTVALQFSQRICIQLLPVIQVQEILKQWASPVLGFPSAPSKLSQFPILLFMVSLPCLLCRSCSFVLVWISLDSSCLELSMLPEHKDWPCVGATPVYIKCAECLWQAGDKVSVG